MVDLFLRQNAGPNIVFKTLKLYIGLRSSSYYLHDSEANFPLPKNELIMFGQVLTTCRRTFFKERYSTE